MGTFPTPDEAFDEYLKLYDEGVAADGRVVAAISYAEQFGFNMFDRAHFLTSRLRGAKMVRERVAGLVVSLTDRRCRWRRVGAGGGGGEREEAVMAPYPVAHYPTLPPVGRCSCAPCSRRRRMSVLRAALPAMSGLAAYANAVSVAGRLCEDTPAAKIEKAIALTGAICQMPLAISESLARIGREHRLARDVWADRQRGILKGESLVDPKGTKEIADMLARFKEERGISDEVKLPVVIQTRQTEMGADFAERIRTTTPISDCFFRRGEYADRKRDDDA